MRMNGLRWAIVAGLAMIWSVPSTAFGQTLTKEVTDGPDVDGDGVVDVVVEVGQASPTTYTFVITAEDLDGGTLIRDTVPAEWDVVDAVASDANDTVDVFLAGKSGKSATKIEWVSDTGTSMLAVTVTSRERGRSGKFSPTSCGALFLNDGAFAADAETGEVLLDADGNPIVSNALCLAAVEDVDGDGVIVRDGTGDEDGDTLLDFEEACMLGTDPCNADTDGDGVPDNEDADPLDPEVS